LGVLALLHALSDSLGVAAQLSPSHSQGMYFRLKSWVLPCPAFTQIQLTSVSFLSLSLILCDQKEKETAKT
jgi:hypothetical protein